MLLDNSTLFTTAIAGTILASGSTCLANATSNETPETEKVPVVYIIPMEGQMGTDIHEDNMAKVIEDIPVQGSTDGLSAGMTVSIRATFRGEDQVAVRTNL